VLNEEKAMLFQGKAFSLLRIDLKKGLQIITLHIVEIDQMNYEFINFKWVK
jgi:hypothetical protein